MTNLQAASKLRVNNAVMLVFSSHGWGNRKKADTKKIETRADKSLLSMSKKLIDSQTYTDISNFQTAVYNWIQVNAVPSFILRGAYLFNTSMVEAVEEYLQEQQKELRTRVEPLLEEYRQKILEAETRLDDQFNAGDYPSPEQLRDSFYFEWKWTVFDIPDGLPEKIFNQEKMKAENMWREAAEQISQSLRKAFAELIGHANSLLEPNADGKTKGFKNSSFDNIDQFITTFKNRNIVDDKDLERLVEQAKNVLVSVNDPQELKRDTEMKDIVSRNFKEIQDKLSTMVEVKPSRKFDFE